MAGLFPGGTMEQSGYGTWPGPVLMDWYWVAMTTQCGQWQRRQMAGLFPGGTMEQSGYGTWLSSVILDWCWVAITAPYGRW